MDENVLKTYKLSQQHFKKFQNFFREWVDLFGMKDWELAFFFEKTSVDGDDARASVHFEHESRIVVVCLNKEWAGYEPTDHNLSRCAYHEVLELVLGRINYFTRNKATGEEIDGEVHRIIRIFENIHFEDLWSRNRSSKRSSPS